ncbi:MAG: T9SS type A sorting domain-containing protein, partial [Flavobacteriales bacterium]|nr:T9SS type A sorting domain-containing protein [Flavobacteriales bacterium]
MYIIDPLVIGSQSNRIPTSITYAVSANTSQVGMEIRPMIWEYNEDSLFTTPGSIDRAFDKVVASSLVPYTIQTSNIGQLMTLSLDTGSGFLNGLTTGQYIVGWEVTNTNGGSYFEVQEDVSLKQFQDDVTCFINLAHNPGWGWVNANPVIRLNFGNLPIASNVKKNPNSTTTFNVIPNPNNGEFSLTITSTEKVTYDLNIRNVLGQVIHTDNITVSGTIVEQMDLTQFEKGVYFVSLENGAERLLKKLI